MKLSLLTVAAAAVVVKAAYPGDIVYYWYDIVLTPYY
jgi:hypothetical protein